MADYVLTEETREHRLETFKKMLPLVKSTVDDLKQLIKEQTRLGKYERKEEELTSTIETIKSLVQSGVFSFEKSEDEIIQKRIRELEDELERTKEFIQVLEQSVDELENRVSYYKLYFQKVVSLVYDTNEPILDEKDIECEYFREYVYLIFVLPGNGRDVRKEALLTEQAIEKMEKISKETKFKVLWNFYKKIPIIEFFAAFE